MRFKGSEWRKEALRKRKIKYTIIDCLLMLVWVLGTLCFSVAVVVFLLTGNWELPAILCAAACALWFVHAALNHGTIKL